MKRLMIIGLFVMAGLGVHAQSDADLWELTKGDLKTEYKTIIIESLNFSDEEATAFWPIFNDFFDQKSALLDEDMKMLKDYADHYDQLDDAKIKSLVHGAMGVDSKRLKLRESYFKKISKVLPARKAGKLYQIDNQVSILLDFQIISQVPLIE
jgi:phage terminase small subunit